MSSNKEMTGKELIIMLIVVPILGILLGYCIVNSDKWIYGENKYKLEYYAGPVYNSTFIGNRTEVRTRNFDVLIDGIVPVYKNGEAFIYKDQRERMWITWSDPNNPKQTTGIMHRLTDFGAN